MAAGESADWVVHAKQVVTMDANRRIIDGGAVAIRGPRIVGVGTREEIDRSFQPAHTLDRPDAALMPGFIDTHTHAPMSLFRAIADDKTLDEWLTRYIFPAEARNVDAEFVRWGTRLACLEMLLAGITTYTDMYYFEDVEAETAKQAGIRGVLGQSVIGFPAPDYRTWQEAIAATEGYMQRFKSDELIVPAVAPHAIYTTNAEALKASHDLAVKYGAPLLIHVAETKKERDVAIAKYGMSPTKYLEQLHVLDGRVVAAHDVWDSDEDLDILKRHNTGVAHCPSSNTKLASGVARVVDMLRLGINVGLGTDGFAGSNDTADLILEMDIGSKLQKVTRMDPTALPAQQVAEMATIGGAHVVGLEHEIGSVEVGKRADLITIALDRANATPLYNFYSELAYAAKAGDVQDVFINGRQIVSSRHVLTLNAPDIMQRAGQYGTRIAKSLAIPKQN